MPRQVSVKITADTSGFDNSVAGMAAKTQRSAEQIKAAASQAIGSVSKLTAENNQLVRAQAKVADSVAIVRAAEERLAAVRARSNATAKQHAAAEENLAKVQRGLVLSQRDLATAQEAADKKSRITTKIADPGVQDLGQKFAIAGAAVAVGVGLAVRASADFEQAMSGVASTGHYTQGQLDLLSKAAVAGGQATQYSATEAAQGEAELVKAGLSVQQVLGGGLTGALNLAAAGNLSVADSASAAATAINQFGLQGSDATHVADRFVQIAGVAQGETSDVAEAFKDGAVTAHQYGLSIDDTSDVLGAFAKNGLVGAQAGTLLKSSLTNLYAPTGRVQKALDSLGVSAYDAAGNAKPVADVAQQLHDKLAPLSDDAKNNALARIFGKETLQGGAILAQEGAKGLGAIRKELDQFPTAAQTAATKMDNLKGDVEQLSGSLETGLIKTGSGANGFLRGLAQSATRAVNGFTDLPGAVQQGALGLASLSAVGLLGAGGLIKVVGAASSAKDALVTLGIISEESAAKTSTAVGKIGKGVAVATVALGVAAGAGAGFDAIFRKNDPTLSDAGQAIASLGSSARAAAPQMSKFFDSTGKKYNDIGPVTADIHSLGDALVRVTKPTTGQSINDKISGALPGKDQLEVLNDQFGQLDTVLTRTGATSAPDAAKGFSAIASAAAAQKVPLDKLVALFPQYKAQLADQATALGVTVPDSAQVYADWMGGKVPDAVLAAAKANPQAAASFGVVAAAADQTSKGFDTAIGSLKNLISPQKISAKGAQALSKELFGNAQAALAASDAQIAYGQAVQAAAKGVTKKDPKTGKETRVKGINPNTAAGAANLSLLNAQAAAYQQVASAQIAAGKSAGTVSAGTQKARDSFIKNAEAMGVSSGKAKDLADKYGLIPKNVKVKIEEQVQKNAEDELTKLKALDGSVITPKIQALIDQGKYKEALSKVKDLQKERQAKVKAEADAKKAGLTLDEFTKKKREAKLKAQAEGVDAASAKLQAAAKARKAKIKAEADAKAAAGDLNSAANRKRLAKINAIAAGIGAVQGAINSIHGKNVSIHVVTTKSTRVADNDKGSSGSTGGLITHAGFIARGPLRRSEGGPVWGAGTATSDSIPALLSNGEFVIRAAAVKAVGMENLTRINAKGFATGGPVGYAKGGTVGLTTDREVLRAVVAQFHVDQARNLNERRQADKELAKAMKKLNDTQSAALDSIKSLSSSLQEPYRSKSTDVDDVLASLKDGATDLTAFGSQIKQLKALGLDQGVIDQITSDGAINGGELASQILAGGKGLVDSLNQANRDLVKAGTALGETSAGLAEPKKKKALGGYITGPGTGTSDSIPLLASNGEYVVNAAGTAANRSVLDAINYGRAKINEHRFMPAYAGGGSSVQNVDRRIIDSSHVVLQGDFGGIERAARVLRSQKADNLTMARLSVAL